MKLTEFKFEWKVVFPDHTPDITGTRSVEGRSYWLAYANLYSTIRKVYKDYKGVNIFVKRHQNDDNGTRSY